MAPTYDELKKKTVVQLQEFAASIDHEAVKGHTQMNKEQLLQALCTALGISAGKKQMAKIVDKTKVKTQIHALKKSRTDSLAAKDGKKFKQTLVKIRQLKRKLRKSKVKK